MVSDTNRTTLLMSKPAGGLHGNGRVVAQKSDVSPNITGLYAPFFLTKSLS